MKPERKMVFRLNDAIKQLANSIKKEDSSIVIPKYAINNLFNDMFFHRNCFNSYQCSVADDLVRLGPPRDIKGPLVAKGVSAQRLKREMKGKKIDSAFKNQVNQSSGKTILDVVLAHLSLDVIEEEDSDDPIVYWKAHSTTEVKEFLHRLDLFRDSLD